MPLANRFELRTECMSSSQKDVELSYPLDKCSYGPITPSQYAVLLPLPYRFILSSYTYIGSEKIR